MLILTLNCADFSLFSSFGRVDFLTYRFDRHPSLLLWHCDTASDLFSICCPYLVEYKVELCISLVHLVPFQQTKVCSPQQVVLHTRSHDETKHCMVITSNTTHKMSSRFPVTWSQIHEDYAAQTSTLLGKSHSHEYIMILVPPSAVLVNSLAKADGKSLHKAPTWLTWLYNMIL